jgi:hypothetical protein
MDSYHCNIEYTLNDPSRPGCGEKHRLLTTLTDASRHPAKRLIVLYHERWDIEIFSSLANPWCLLRICERNRGKVRD